MLDDYTIHYPSFAHSSHSRPRLITFQTDLFYIKYTQ